MTWKKGQSGNPRGAPKRGLSFKEIIARELEEVDPRSGLPYRQAVVRAMLKLAVSGDPHALEAARWLADRSDGRVPQSVSVDQQHSVSIVPWAAADPALTRSRAWDDPREAGGDGRRLPGLVDGTAVVLPADSPDEDADV